MKFWEKNSYKSTLLSKSYAGQLFEGMFFYMIRTLL